MAVTSLSLSILFQGFAAILAFRLNRRFGWRWAWMLLSLAILLMTVRRCVTLGRLLASPEFAGVEDADDFPVSEFSSVLSLIVSLLILAGVGLIEPVFRKMVIAEALVAADKERVERELRHHEEELQIARDIQGRFFPEAPPDVEGFDIAGLSIPCSETGGDYFDYIPTTDGGVGVVLGDVMGHGIGSALLMSAIRAYVRTVADPRYDPGETLTRVNRCMFRDMEGQGFVTMFFTRLQTDNRRLDYVGAGHMAYLVKASGETQTLPSTAPPVNVVADIRYVTSDPIRLNPGDVVLVVSDGVTEASSPDGAMFGWERAVQFVRANAEKTPREIAAVLYSAVREFAAGSPPTDDTTIVVIKSER